MNYIKCIAVLARLKNQQINKSKSLITLCYPSKLGHMYALYQLILQSGQHSKT